MGGGAGTSSQSQASQQSSTFQPPPWLLEAGQQAIQSGEVLQQSPFQVPVQPIAGFSPQQQQAFQQVQNMQGMSQPFTEAGAALEGMGAFPNIGQYFGAESQGVLGELKNLDAQQMAQLTGNAATQAGGLGADRIAIAQSELANQQNLAAGSTLSGIMGQSVGQAQSGAGLQQQAGQGLAGLGQQALTEGLQGTQAEFAAGSQQQQQQQNIANSQYQNLLQRIGWPYQTTSYLAEMAGGMAPTMGGSGVGTGFSQSSMTASPLTQMGQAKGMMGGLGGGMQGKGMESGGRVPMALGGPAMMPGQAWNPGQTIPGVQNASPGLNSVGDIAAPSPPAPRDAGGPAMHMKGGGDTPPPSATEEEPPPPYTGPMTPNFQEAPMSLPFADVVATPTGVNMNGGTPVSDIGIGGQEPQSMFVQPLGVPTQGPNWNAPQTGSFWETNPMVFPSGGQPGVSGVGAFGSTPNMTSEMLNFGNSSPGSTRAGLMPLNIGGSEPIDGGFPGVPWGTPGAMKPDMVGGGAEWATPNAPNLPPTGSQVSAMFKPGAAPAKGGKKDGGPAHMQGGGPPPGFSGGQINVDPAILQQQGWSPQGVVPGEWVSPRSGTQPGTLYFDSFQAPAAAAPAATPNTSAAPMKLPAMPAVQGPQMNQQQPQANMMSDLQQMFSGLGIGAQTQGSMSPMQTLQNGLQGIGQFGGQGGLQNANTANLDATLANQQAGMLSGVMGGASSPPGNAQQGPTFPIGSPQLQTMGQGFDLGGSVGSSNPMTPPSSAGGTGINHPAELQRLMHERTQLLGMRPHMDDGGTVAQQGLGVPSPFGGAVSPADNPMMGLGMVPNLTQGNPMMAAGSKQSLVPAVQIHAQPSQGQQYVSNMNQSIAQGQAQSAQAAAQQGQGGGKQPGHQPKPDFNPNSPNVAGGESGGDPVLPPDQNGGDVGGLTPPDPGTAMSSGPFDFGGMARGGAPHYDDGGFTDPYSASGTAPPPPGPQPDPVGQAIMQPIQNFSSGANIGYQGWGNRVGDPQPWNPNNPNVAGGPQEYDAAHSASPGNVFGGMLSAIPGANNPINAPLQQSEAQQVGFNFGKSLYPGGAQTPGIQGSPGTQSGAAATPGLAQEPSTMGGNPFGAAGMPGQPGSPSGPAQGPTIPQGGFGGGSPGQQPTMGSTPTPQPRPPGMTAASMNPNVSPGASGVGSRVSPAGYQVLNAIASAEVNHSMDRNGQRSGYNEMVKGHPFDLNKGHPGSYIPRSSNLFYHYPDGRVSTASGRYQETYTTYKDNVRYSQSLPQNRGLDVTSMSPQAQDIRAMDKAQRLYQAQGGWRHLQGSTGNLQQDVAKFGRNREFWYQHVMPALRREWTSVPGGIQQTRNPQRWVQTAMTPRQMGPGQRFINDLGSSIGAVGQTFGAPANWKPFGQAAGGRTGYQDGGGDDSGVDFSQLEGKTIGDAVRQNPDYSQYDNSTINSSGRIPQPYRAETQLTPQLLSSPDAVDAITQVSGEPRQTIADKQRGYMLASQRGQQAPSPTPNAAGTPYSQDLAANTTDWQAPGTEGLSPTKVSTQPVQAADQAAPPSETSSPTAGAPPVSRETGKGRGTQYPVVDGTPGSTTGTRPSQQMKSKQFHDSPLGGLSRFLIGWHEGTGGLLNQQAIERGEIGLASHREVFDETYKNGSADQVAQGLEGELGIMHKSHDQAGETAQPQGEQGAQPAGISSPGGGGAPQQIPQGGGGQGMSQQMQRALSMDREAQTGISALMHSGDPQMLSQGLGAYQGYLNGQINRAKAMAYINALSRAGAEGSDEPDWHSFMQHPTGGGTGAGAQPQTGTSPTAAAPPTQPANQEAPTPPQAPQGAPTGGPQATPIAAPGAVMAQPLPPSQGTPPLDFGAGTRQRPPAQPVAQLDQGQPQARPPRLPPPQQEAQAAQPGGPEEALVDPTMKAAGMNAAEYRNYLQAQFDHWNRRAAQDAAIPAMSMRDQNKAKFFGDQINRMDAARAAPVEEGAKERAKMGVEYGVQPAARPGMEEPEKPAGSGGGRYGASYNAPDSAYPDLPNNEAALRGVEETGKEDTKKAHEAMEKSEPTLMKLQQLRQALGELPKTGWGAPGPYSAALYQKVAKFNDVMRRLNIMDPRKGHEGQTFQINPQAVGSYQEAGKLTTQLGFELSRTLGAREAQQIVDKAIEATPGWAMTEEGQHKIMNTLISANQRVVDFGKGIDKWQSNPRSNGYSTRGYRQWFDKANPTSMYSAHDRQLYNAFAKEKSLRDPKTGDATLEQKAGIRDVLKRGGIDPNELF